MPPEEVLAPVGGKPLPSGSRVVEVPTERDVILTIKREILKVVTIQAVVIVTAIVIAMAANSWILVALLG